MSRKDYTRIAAIISRWRRQSNDSAMAAIVCDLGELFKQDNTRFDAARWHAACACQPKPRVRDDV
jgi:hypothetical protein